MDARQDTARSRPWSPQPWSPEAEADPRPALAADNPAGKRETWHARIRRYNSGLDPESTRFRAAVLLLAALELGHNLDLLSRRTGLDRGFVSRAARRLIDNGIWVEGRTVAGWTAADEASGAFWNDVAVAEGRLCRRTGPDGSFEWAPAGYWNKSYDFTKTVDTVAATYHDPGDLGSGPPVSLVEERADPAGGQPAGTDTDSSADARKDRSERKPGSLEEIFSDAVWIR